MTVRAPEASPAGEGTFEGAARLRVLSSADSGYFARRIAGILGVDELTPIERREFHTGEKYYRIAVRARHELAGSDAVYVASTHTDENLLELVRVAGALASDGARRLIFAVPFYGYSTMERAVRPGEAVTAKSNARLLSSLPHTMGGNTFLMLDLHSPGIVHYFEGDCLRFELSAERVLAQEIERIGLGSYVLASADLGRARRVQRLAEQLGTDMAFVSKSRDFELTRVLAVIGDVRGRDVVIYDDMTRSGGTLIHAAEAYLRMGARTVHAALSHLALNDAAVAERLLSSPIQNVITTNSHPMSQVSVVQQSDRFVVADVSPIFAAVIGSLLR